MQAREIIITLILSILVADTGLGQYCTTVPSDTSQVLQYHEVRSILTRRSSQTFTIRLALHLLDYDSGILGVSPEEAMQEVWLMQADFTPQDICFAVTEITEIINSDIMEDWNDSTDAQIAEDLNAQYGQPDRIDIFILPPAFGNWDLCGSAFDIPNDYLAISGSCFGSHVLSHEVGHTLGLLHTHQNYDLFNDGEIVDPCHPTLERVNGSNCTTAGDKCCDTPADPESTSDGDSCYTIGLVFDCNDDLFVPDFDNIMSYSGGCWQFFTPDQRNRMYAELESGSIGPNLLLTNIIVLSSTAISSGEISESAGMYIDHPADVIYEISQSAEVTHSAGGHVQLRPGFVARPGAGGYYQSSIHALCNE